ncbi:hypothetical protein V6N13_137021 [Hibiscus sabdariffa]
MQYKARFILMLLTISLGSSIVGADDDCTGNGGSRIAYTIIVDKSGGGNFTSVQSAIDSIPPRNNRWIKIHINPGRDRKVTTVTFNRHDRTDTNATFTSIAGNLFVRGITFQDCSINVTACALSHGYITAQGRNTSNDPSGFVFKGGVIFGAGGMLGHFMGKRPESNTSKRVPWVKKLSADQIKQFSLWSFVDHDGWISRLPWK